MQARVFFLVLFLAIGGGVAWYLGYLPLNAAPAQPQGRRAAQAGDRVPVVPGTVTKKDVPIYLDGLGTVQAFNAVTVRARVDGELQKVAFTEGQDVKVGDLLAIIDPRPYQAALDQAVGKKAQDDATLANARRDLQRYTDLRKEGNYATQQQLDTQKALVDQLVATIQQDQAQIDNARVQLGYTSIVSPLGGRVGLRQVDQGNIVHAGDANGIVMITQMKPISVVFTLPEQNLRAILAQSGQGQLQVVALDRDNATELTRGQLAVIDNQIDQTTGTVKLKATFANDPVRLWPGQFVNIRLLLTVRKDGIIVPAQVVQRGPKGPFAFVITQDQTVEVRQIKVAQIEGGEALVDDGLQPGETVVVDGQSRLQPGSKVSTRDDSAQPRQRAGGDGQGGDQPQGSRRRPPGAPQQGQPQQGQPQQGQPQQGQPQQGQPQQGQQGQAQQGGGGRPAQ